MKKLLLIPLIFLGCNTFTGKSSTNTTNTTYYIKVFTLAPVRDAIVIDSNNQVAEFDSNNNRYVFKNPISFPVYVKPSSNTYIDVDYDNKKSANDILPITFSENEPLITFMNRADLLTTAYYRNDMNISTNEYILSLNNQYGIDFTKNDINTYKLLFSAFNEFVDLNQTNLDTLYDYYLNTNHFFNDYLNNLTDNDKIKYYSFYDSLVLLDKKKISRADTIHKPSIPTLLRNPITILSQNNSLDVFDIKKLNNFVFTASGHDELVKLDNNLLINYKTTPKEDAFAYNIFYQKLNDECIFIADGIEGIRPFDITTNTPSNYVPIFQELVTDIKGYTSALNNKKLLAISTNNGFYLLNTLENFDGNCTIKYETNTTTQTINEGNSTREINVTTYTPKTLTTEDFLIVNQNKSFSSVFRKDGTYLYVSQENKLKGFDISILNKNYISSTATDLPIQNNETPYNLLLTNNDNDLFISTNKGIQVYDVSNDPSILNFISEYTSEGATLNYHPKMYFYSQKSLLLFTDGYKGLKILKYDSSFNPMLCGVAYFSPLNDTSAQAKVNSVYVDETTDEVYIGIDSYGIIKVKLDDLLFRHCK